MSVKIQSMTTFKTLNFSYPIIFAVTSATRGFPKVRDCYIFLRLYNRRKVVLTGDSKFHKMSADKYEKHVAVVGGGLVSNQVTRRSP